MVQDLFKRPKLVEFDEDFEFEMMRGDTLSLQIVLAGEAPDGTISPYVITGARIRMTVRKTHDDSIIFAKDSNISGDVTVLDATGLVLRLGGSVFELNIFPSNTNSVVPARYVWDVEITDASGSIHTPIKGFMNLLADVTRP